MKKPIFRYRNLRQGFHEPTRDAIAFVLNKFCPRMADRILVMVKGNELLLKRHNEYAYCIYVSTDTTCREFQIIMDNTIDQHTWIRTLMHELVHVKQYAKGEMAYYERKHSLVKWRQSKINMNTQCYWDLPWEIEAHGREEGLTQQFMKAFPQHVSFCKNRKK
jgi:hypothetical protein